MTVLVVDDQISVVSAILSGIHWRELGVESVLKAYNAYEAKSVLRTHPVDIMLCDIEMPAEDGLSLYRWAREHEYPLECIFLTSHADFHYAKEALRLGSFDYILQPARYEDIQAALQRAIQKADSRREDETVYSYGKLVRARQGLLIDSRLGKYLHTQQSDTVRLQRVLDQLNLGLHADASFCFALLDMMGFAQAEGESAFKNDEIFRYGVNNILAELALDYGQKALVLRYDADMFAFILYSEGGTPLNEESFAGLLQRFIDISMQHYRCRVAAYCAGITGFSDLGTLLPALLALRENNVIRAARIFHLGDVPSDAEPEHISALERQRWSTLAAQGGFQSVRAEIGSCLDVMETSASLTAKALQDFYSDFMQVVFEVVRGLGLTINDVLPDFAQREQFMNGYHSIAKARRALGMIGDALEHVSGGCHAQEDQIDVIVRYIHDNIETDIRRNDLAAAVYLSPDYVSHLFRQRMDMSLQDFVIQEKMKVAQNLLRTTSLPISVVAVKVGYSNFSYFSKTYKRIYGVSPAGERKSDETK